MPSDPPEISLRKQPRQGRSAATVEAILEASARILETQGMAGLNTNLVAEHAGVSVGSLYQYFPSKEAIVAELIRKMRSEVLEDLAGAIARFDNRPLADQVEPLIRATVAHHQRRPALAAVLEELEPTLPIAGELGDLKARIAQVVVALLKRHNIPDPQTAAFDLAAMGSGIANAAARAGVTDFDPVAVRIARAVRGYLEL